MNESQPQFEPVHKLTEADKIETSTGEEGEDELFKMLVQSSYAALALCSVDVACQQESQAVQIRQSKL